VSTKPVWLLDVDGVINVTRPGWGTAPIRRNVFAGGRDWRISFSGKLIMMIRHMITMGHVEIRWCSTWCGDTEQLEKVLGLPHLESAFPAPAGQRIGELKIQAARGVLAQGRPLIWTDDTEVPESGPLFDELTIAGSSLLIRPIERRGLTPDNMHAIKAFCADRSGVER
jgi:hypothetical protein